MATHVIILNGAGSVGKTTTAKAIQALARRPFLHVQMDTFLDMAPERLTGHPYGLTFTTRQTSEGPCTEVQSGPTIERLLTGMRYAVLALAEQSADVIVDDVFTGSGEAQAYRELLAPFGPRLVGLYAPLDVLERRERTRGDRTLGLARGQYEGVHAGVAYDLRIDTADHTPEQVAAIVCSAFEL